MRISPLHAPLMLTAAPASGPPPPPTSARVTSISDWLHLFHNTRGQFRLPSLQGAELEQLDIDITHIEPQAPLPHKDPLHLPKVAVLTLRGGDLLDDDDERMEYIVEVMAAIKPQEVRWLSNTCSVGYSPTAHLVHPAILEVGEHWSSKGMLRKLVLQGGFPSRTCPDITLMNPNKPLDFAFRTWSVEEVHWQLDNFTPAAAVTIVQHYLQAINRAYWQGNNNAVPTRALTFSSIPFQALDRIRALPAKLQLPKRATEWIQDVAFIGKGDSVSRLWGEHPPVDERLLARLHAELLVLQERRILPMAMLWA